MTLKNRVFGVCSLAALLGAGVSGAIAQDGAKPAPPKPTPAASRPPLKAQSDVAAHGKSFARVKLSDPLVVKAMKADNLDGAKKLIGKSGTFTGIVYKVFSPSSHSVVVLNFAADYRTALTAALRPKGYAAFPDLKTLEGKRVLITGKFTEYSGRIEVLLTAPDQVKIVD